MIVIARTDLRRKEETVSQLISISEMEFHTTQQGGILMLVSFSNYNVDKQDIVFAGLR